MLNQINGQVKKRFNSVLRQLWPFIEDPLYASGRQKIGGLAALAFELMVILWLGQFFVNKSRQLFKLNSQEERLNQKVAQAEKDGQLIKSRPQAVESLIQSLPPEKESHRLLQKLNQLSGSHRLSLTSLSFLEPKNLGGELREQFLKVTLSGVFKDIIAFVEEVEKNSRPVITESVEFTIPEKPKSVGVVITQIVFKTYFTDNP